MGRITVTFRQPVLVGCLLAGFVATPALAQNPDPIGDLLSGEAPVSTAPPAAEVAPQPAPAPAPTPTPPPTPTPTPMPTPAPAPTAAPAPRPAPAPVPTVIPRAAPQRPSETIASQPVFLDERRAVAGELTAEERSYEARLRASFNSAQGLQGPLDGGWMLSMASGADLYALRFVDRGSGALEGAWRDARRPGALDGFGFLENIERSGGRVTLRFSPRPGAPPTVITLSSSGQDQWSGEMIESGTPRSVTLRRR
ncbi:hypothetical protein [Phenylobacterium sp.]|uniref:hypothetical protein n=1 Tax=Phenylobacterium sp. TaxID=1871053 RepID=UPI002731D7E8|nr:hypothetical protein [Phenylobacterium sp.]MDP1616260.1 hypothetical protein [Phenylobacterium sp.]MDP1989320.1 hypothetical protein [Phenylobacterium sp.]